jgi:hypothetical protein
VRIAYAGTKQATPFRRLSRALASFIGFKFTALVPQDFRKRSAIT